MLKSAPKIISGITIIISFLFLFSGINTQKSLTQQTANYHALQVDYYSHSKVVRDGAEIGSELSNQFVTLQHFPSELSRLETITLNHIFIAIFLILLSISVKQFEARKK